MDSLATGGLAVFHLKRLWSRCTRDKFGQSNGSHADEWAMDNAIYHGLNLPIEETNRRKSRVKIY